MTKLFKYTIFETILIGCLLPRIMQVAVSQKTECAGGLAKSFLPPGPIFWRSHDNIFVLITCIIVTVCVVAFWFTRNIIHVDKENLRVSSSVQEILFGSYYFLYPSNPQRGKKQPTRAQPTQLNKKSTTMLHSSSASFSQGKSTLTPSPDLELPVLNSHLLSPKRSSGSS